MILSDSEILRRLEVMSDERIVISPEPAVEDYQPASVDLHLSSDIYVYRHSKIPIEQTECPGMGRRIGPTGYVMAADQFILGSTVERIEVPTDLAARVEGKSSLGRLGLSVHVTAGFIDPGFRGNITLELKNFNSMPITLRAGMSISQLCFQELSGKVLRPYGSEGLGSKYQDSEGTIPSRLSFERE